MKLLKSITTLTFILCLTSSYGQWGKWKKIKGDGNITTSTRTTGNYECLKAAGPMDFILVPGTEGQIRIKADANLMAYIITEIKDNKLVVKVEDGKNLKPSQTIIITVPYESIDKVSLAGSGDINNSGVIKANAFKVSLAGSGDINLTIDSESVESSIAGSGDIELKGTTTDITTKITGSGDFDGSSLKSINVIAKITGSGSSKVNCSGKLKARITGSGDVIYTGTPKNKDTKITGSGSVRH